MDEIQTVINNKRPSVSIAVYVHFALELYKVFMEFISALSYR